MQKSIDIDEAIKYIQSWDQYTEKLLEESEDLKRQVFLLTKRCELNKNSESQAKQEVNQLHKIILTLQETLNSQSQIFDENEAKKIEIAKLKRRVSSLEEKLQQLEKNARDKIEEVNGFNKKEKECLKKEFEEKVEKIQNSLQNAIDGKIKQLKVSEERNAELTKEKQTEVMKIRLECDSKIQKVQKQPSIEPQVQAGSSMMRNDILRRKMQHLQAEADAEIAALKKKVLELEKALDKQQAQKKRKLSFH